MNRKTVRISPKRQITIPKEFYEALCFTNEAECIVCGNELILRPVSSGSSGEFAEEILKDLIAEGLSGSELLSEFKRRQSQIRHAVNEMLKDAESVAIGNGEYCTYDEVFDSKK